MYIGIGTIVLILLIALVILFLARRLYLQGRPISMRAEKTRGDRPGAAEIWAQEEIRAQGDRAQSEGRIQEALDTAAAVAESTGGLGTPRRPINQRSPFMIGMAGAFGVAVADGLVELIIGWVAAGYRRSARGDPGGSGHPLASA
jgi:hypothetical protein